MSIDIEQGRARVVVTPTIYGTYESGQLEDLRVAITRACRALGTDDALRLAAAVEDGNRRA